MFGRMKENENGLGRGSAKTERNIFPVLAWLSLVGLLASRARRRFTKQLPF